MTRKLDRPHFRAGGVLLPKKCTRQDGEAALSVRTGSAITDTQRMDWLEQTLVSLHEIGPLMGGQSVAGQLRNKARDDKGLGGPSYFKVHHRNIREAIDEAMQWPNKKAQP